MPFRFPYQQILSGLEGNEVDIPDQQGFRASHYATVLGNNMCLAALLDAGANPNALDPNMRTPVSYGKFL